MKIAEKSLIKLSRWVCLCWVFAGNTEPLHFSSINGLVEQEIGRIVLPQIYGKLDMDIIITPLPARRAQFDAVTGFSDGEIMRIYDYGQESENVIRVPTAYFQLETRAFALTSSSYQIESVTDLQGFHIVTVRGVMHTEKAVKGIARVTELNSTEQIMQFVARGRADIALTNTSDGISALKTLNIDTVSSIGPPLQTMPLYHYIHKDHTELVPQVDQVIQQLTDSGELAKMVEIATTAVYRIDN